VDANNCISNNLHDVYNTLGIEAVREELFRNINRVFANQVNHRHAIQLVDFMTRRGGGITAFTRYSQSARFDPPIKRIALEEPFKGMSEAAFFGETDQLVDPASCQMVGAPIAIGTCSMGIRIDRDMLKQHGRSQPKAVSSSFKAMYQMADIKHKDDDTNMTDKDPELCYQPEPDPSLSPTYATIMKGIDTSL
jgi:hypothetical protein